MSQPIKRLKASAEDLVGLIRLGNRLRRAAPRELLVDPRGRAKRRWKDWAKRLVRALLEREPAHRPVPSCHELGTDPAGYDWGMECSGCAAKITCALAGGDSFVLSVGTKASEVAVQTLAATVGRVSVFAKQRRPPPALGLQPAPALWSVFPSGMPIPRIFPRRAMAELKFPFLYRIRLLNIVGAPHFWVDGAWEAMECARLLRAERWTDLAAHLEVNWSSWQRIESEVAPADSTALNAWGLAAHIHRHILLDRGSRSRSNSSSLRFMRLDARSIEGSASRTYHQEGRKLRAEGVHDVWTDPTPSICGACPRGRARADDPSGGSPG